MSADTAMWIVAAILIAAVVVFTAGAIIVLWTSRNGGDGA